MLSATGAVSESFGIEFVARVVFARTAPMSEFTPSDFRRDHRPRDHCTATGETLAKQQKET